MDLWNFVEENDVERTKSLISREQIREIEAVIGVPFGVELTRYVISYGYLACGAVEFYGINSKQMLDSDMVRQSLYLHKYFPHTAKYVALENQGDGDYFIVGSDDSVFEYISENDNLKDVKMKLSEYILKRLEGVI